MKETYYYSFLIDDLPDHFYKAELLLLSLQEYALAPRQNIIIHVTDCVAPFIRSHFEALGFQVKIVPPYLDRKYCNKLLQLDTFYDLKNIPFKGVILFDIDVVITQQIQIEDEQKIWAKIVDAPNPPLPVLLEIFKAAKISAPEAVECDWRIGETLACNMNGGFYYIPKKLMQQCNIAWKKWAEFLFQNPDLFQNTKQMMHIDQISFGMAICSESLQFEHLSANHNFPSHSDRIPRTFDSSLPIVMIHYHKYLNQFGLLISRNKIERLKQALNRINYLILTKYSGKFINTYMQFYAKNLLAKEISLPISTYWNKFNDLKTPTGKKRRLILHAGTPKTGTSSLQLLLGKNRDLLAQEGFWYPKPSNTPMPKHQQLVGLFHKGDTKQLTEYLYDSLELMPEHIHSIIYTTEGIFNHWLDFPVKSKVFIRNLAHYFNVEICAWFREPISFATSLYIQYLKNPKQNGSTKNVYGRDISFMKAMEDEWFLSHLDYFGFYYQLAELVGSNKLSFFLYSGNSVSRFLNHYDIKSLRESSIRQNQSLGTLGVQLIRLVNRFHLSAVNKEKITDLIIKLDELLNRQHQKFELSDIEKQTIFAYTTKQWQEFSKKLIT